MTLQIKEMGTPRTKAPRIPEGTYMGRIQSIVDLGLQPQTDYQTGEPIASKNKVLFTWELPSERITIEDDEGNEVSKPRWISKEYTISNFQRAGLMELVNALSPNISELSELLDFPCMISIGSTRTGNAKVTSVVKPPAGMDVPVLENDPIAFNYSDPSEEDFIPLVGWVKEKIKDAEDYNGFADGWE